MPRAMLAATGPVPVVLLCALVSCAPELVFGAEPAHYELKITSRSLEEALQEFARQSGVQIVFFSSLTDGLRAPELVGEFTTTSAMERLLEGSGLGFRVVNPQTVELRSADAPAPALIAVNTRTREPRAVDGKLDEVLVLGTAEQLVATRVPTALQEIPQSISVVSHQLIEQQNAVNLADVLNHATGIIGRRDSSLGEQLYARSFRIVHYHIDGGAGIDEQLPEPFSLKTTPDLSEFDHVEILRGSDALFSGDANPGATVSLVRKRPESRYQAVASAIYGSWNNKRVELDVTGPIARDGAVRARVDAMYLNTDYFYDRAHLQRKKIFGVVEYDPTSWGTLTVGGSFQADDALPFESGLPIDTRNGDPRLPRDTALTFPWAFNQTQTGEAYVQYRQQLSDGWRVRFNAAAWRDRMAYAYGVFTMLFDAPEDELDNPFALFSGRPSHFTTETADLTLTGAFDAFGMQMELAVGGDFKHLKGTWDILNTGFGDTGDLRTFDPRNYEDPRSYPDGYLGLRGHTTIDQQGEFASLRLHLNDAWSVTGGVRVSSNSQEYRHQIFLDADYIGDDANEYGTSKAVTPFGGVTYQFAGNYVWYASYADIYDSLFKRERLSGGLLGPAHGVNLESGLKGAWRDGALHGSLALYWVHQRDLSHYDPNVDTFYEDRPFCCYVNADSRAYGAELDLSGELAPGWLMTGGYTYNQTNADDSLDQPHLSPRHLLRLWTNVQLRGALSHWTVGGGLQGESRTKVGGEVFCDQDGCPQLVQKSYAVLGLRAAFRIDEDWQLALSVDNVFDKTYYESVEPYELRSWYGPPRNFTLRVDARF